jgi:ribonuclease-3
MLDFILRPIRRNFGRNKSYYRLIDDVFGFIPNNIELYKLALVHKSASIDIGGRSINNERLEFLGDAVIESITSDFLFIEYPDYDEGKLTKLRSKLVSRQSLNAIACKLGLDKHIICCRSINATQKHIFGDAFEAMMGAIYLDQGYNFANRLLINKIYSTNLSLEEVDETETDFKSRLIEWGQKNHHTVLFRTKGAPTGAGATRSFHCTVLVDNLEVGHGIGSSKKEAEQKAAQAATYEPSDEEIARMLDRLDKISK